MRMTREGLALIKRFEGFRGKAYRDPVGIWTIGYGHTSMAGPPSVSEGLQVSRAEADAILRRDVEQFRPRCGIMFARGFEPSAILGAGLLRL